MIGRWIKSILEPPATVRQLQNERASKKALDSHEAFMSAASSTMLLAQDITSSLKSRIDDYTKQIEATSFVLSDALIMCDTDGRIETFNPAAELIYGWRADEVVGKNIAILFELDGLRLRAAELIVAFSAPTIVEPTERACSLSSRIKGKHQQAHLFDSEVAISSFVRTDGSHHYLLLVRDVTEEREAETRVLALSQRQEAILSSMPDILATFDEQNRYTSMWTPSGPGIIQHTAEECIGRSIYEVLSYPKARELADQIAMVRNSNSSSFITTQYNYLDDKNPEQSYELRWSKCGNEILLMARNMTEMRRTQGQLQESTEQFRAFGQASSEAMLIHDEENILNFNPRLSEMTGYSAREIASMSPLDFIHPLEREKVRTMQSEIEISRSYDTLFLTKDGLELEVAITAKPVEWKGKRARIKVMRDITHLKDFEQILNISRERYRTLTDNTVDLVCMYDANLDIKFSNQTFKDYVNDQNAKPNLLQFIPEEDHAKVRTHVAALTVEQPVKRTLHRIMMGDVMRWQDWIDRAVFDASGKLVEIQSVGRDVTDYVSRFNKDCT